MEYSTALEDKFPERMMTIPPIQIDPTMQRMAKADEEMANTYREYLADTKCFYCDSKLYRKGKRKHVSDNAHYTEDHVFPKSFGGRATVPCCRTCNMDKAQLTLAQFRMKRYGPVARKFPGEEKLTLLGFNFPVLVEYFLDKSESSATLNE